MADRQYQTTGESYYNDVEEATLYQRQVEEIYVNETQQVAVDVVPSLYVNRSNMIFR